MDETALMIFNYFNISKKKDVSKSEVKKASIVYVKIIINSYKYIECGIIGALYWHRIKNKLELL